MQGEADQIPDQEPGNIIFSLVQTEHEIFKRAGADLQAEIEVTLAEAICGFSRVVVKHLDGRGIHIKHPQQARRAIEPGQVLKIEGEGMPYKKSDSKGDLYLTIKIKFPDSDWLQDNQTIEKLRQLLPKPGKPIPTDLIDEVVYDECGNLEDFGADEEEGGNGWVDEDEEDGQQQCATQ